MTEVKIMVTFFVSENDIDSDDFVKNLKCQFSSDYKIKETWVYQYGGQTWKFADGNRNYKLSWRRRLRKAMRNLWFFVGRKLLSRKTG